MSDSPFSLLVVLFPFSFWRPSRRDVLELANLVLGSHGVLQIREKNIGDRSARMRTRKKNGVRNDGQSCGLSSPKRKRGKPNGWACRVFGETSASDMMQRQPRGSNT